METEFLRVDFLIVLIVVTLLLHEYVSLKLLLIGMFLYFIFSYAKPNLNVNSNELNLTKKLKLSVEKFKKSMDKIMKTDVEKEQMKTSLYIFDEFLNVLEKDSYPNILMKYQELKDVLNSFYIMNINFEDKVDEVLKMIRVLILSKKTTEAYNVLPINA
jgi:apolipoprotein N-acyltransferase